MNISEFERTKPRATMKSIDDLINDMHEIIENRSSANPEYVLAKLIVIKNLLKNGE